MHGHPAGSWTKAATIAASVLFLFSGRSLAGDAAAGQLPLHCDQQDSQGQANMCAKASFERANAEMNAIYDDLSSRYSPENRRLLAVSQGHWTDFRNAECDYENAGTVGGSIHRQLVDDCLTRETKARAARLKAQRDCNIDEDSSCNPP